MNKQENEELQAAREEIQILNEVAQGHYLQTNTLEEKLLETTQELAIVNELLAKTPVLELGLEEARVVAGVMLQDDLSSRQLVANLLTAIYGVSIVAQDLKEQSRLDILRNKFGNHLTSKAILRSQELRKYSKELRRQNLSRRKA